MPWIRLHSQIPVTVRVRSLMEIGPSLRRSSSSPVNFHGEAESLPRCRVTTRAATVLFLEVTRQPGKASASPESLLGMNSTVLRLGPISIKEARGTSTGFDCGVDPGHGARLTIEIPLG